MTPKFTTPCFIRKNTPELRNKLEELGYVDNYSELHEGKTMLFAIPSYNGYTEPTFESTSKYNGNLINGKYPIDCGENEKLFLALAALRDDSDKFQWFVWDEEVTLIPRLGKYIPKGGFSFCVVDKFEPIMVDALYHKATPTELIEHSKEK